MQGQPQSNKDIFPDLQLLKKEVREIEHICENDQHGKCKVKQCNYRSTRKENTDEYFFQSQDDEGLSKHGTNDRNPN